MGIVAMHAQKQKENATLDAEFPELSNMLIGLVPQHLVDKLGQREDVRRIVDSVLKNGEVSHEFCLLQNAPGARLISVPFENMERLFTQLGEAWSEMIQVCCTESKGMCTIHFTAL